MNLKDKLAFMPLRYMMPMLWFIIISTTSAFSYIYIKESFSSSEHGDEYVAKLTDFIFLDTLVLFSLVLLYALFSYFVINKRYMQLLKIISGYSQGMDDKKEIIEGNDEISTISKAFGDISQRMNAVLNDMYTFVAILDTKGHVVFVNNTPLHICDLKFSDVKGKKLSDTYWWEYNEDRKEEISKLIQRCIDGEIINHETQIQIKDFQLIWITFSLHPVYDSDGNIEHLVAEGVDISRQKQAYEEMLRHSRKAQMGDMISVIAHQWRQPLSVITSITGQMQIDIALNKLEQNSTLECIDKIEKTISHLSSTMDQFTSFFNPNKEAKETSFSVIVDKSIKILSSSLISKGINVNLSIENEYKISTYEDELIQVVIDMLKNSVDFFEKNSIKDAVIKIHQYHKNDLVCLSILDNAGGIKDKDLSHIFDIYFTTKENNTGSGLGLHMSKMIVEDHCNGEIKVKQHDGGVEFIICLPI